MPRGKKKSASRKKKLLRWTPADVKVLRQNAGKKSLEQIAKILKRTAVAVQLKASNSGISLRRM